MPTHYTKLMLPEILYPNQWKEEIENIYLEAYMRKRLPFFCKHIFAWFFLHMRREEKYWENMPRKDTS